jgi:Family of unknown function (DUF6338)
VSEIFKLFDTTGGVTIQQVLGFLVLVAPGFISLRVYDMQRGGEARQAKDVMIDIVMYSFASDAIVYAASALVSSVTRPAWAHLITVMTVGLFIVTPIGLGAAFFHFQRTMMRLGAFPDTLTTSWSHMMHRIASERADVGAIVTMHDGRAVGARIGPFARRASTSDDLLLDEVWTIDQNRATLVEPSPRSYAVLMNRADCQMIEFVRLDVPPRPSSWVNHEVT